MIVAKYPCPFDGLYGQLGFLLCSDEKTIVLECVECNAIWLRPEHIEEENYLIAQPPDFIVPGTNCSVKFPKARWATRDEVVQYGWEKYIERDTQSE